MALDLVVSNMTYLFEVISNFTLTQIGAFYRYIYSMPLNILNENLAYVSIGLYLLWFIKAYLSRTELVAKEGSLTHAIFDKFTSIHAGYRPTIWCFPSTLNTIVFSVIQRCVKHHYYREVLKTNDGGLIAIDWANLGSPKPLILLVLPGLTGSSKDNYVTHLADEAVKLGCTAVVMNYRGIEVELKTARTYCATNYDDLNQVIEHIHERYPTYRIMAVGVSLGGLKLGGYLASKQYRSQSCLVNNAMIISAPMNVFFSCEELEKTHHFFTFNRHLARSLSKCFAKYKHLFEKDERYDCQAIARSYSIRDFDNNFTCKQFGYKSCEDYYRDACLDTKILDIKTPTLFVNAADDMFSPERAFPLDKIRQNPYTAMVVTKYGGHISFCEGLLPTGCNYPCRILREYLQHMLAEPCGGSSSVSGEKQKEQITMASTSSNNSNRVVFE